MNSERPLRDHQRRETLIRDAVRLREWVAKHGHHLEVYIDREPAYPLRLSKIDWTRAKYYGWPVGDLTSALTMPGHEDGARFPAKHLPSFLFPHGTPSWLT